MSDSPPINRLPVLDAMRFLAVCAIVWIHTTETHPESTIFCRWAVPFFTIASIWLLGQSVARHPERPWIAYAWHRTRRLYGTFLIWNAIYLAAIAFKHAAFHTGKQIIWVPDLLWGGAAEHLWFLTFLWIASVIAFPICRAAISNRVVAWVILLLSLAAGTAISFMPVPLSATWNPGTQVVVENVWMATPAFFVGLAITAVWAFRSTGYQPVSNVARHGLVARVTNTLPVFGMVVFIVANYLLARMNRHAGLEALGGLGAFWIALAPASGSFVSLLAKLGRYAFGVYVIHVLCVESLQAVQTRTPFRPSLVSDIIVAVAAIGLSLIATRLLRKTLLAIE